MKTYKKYINDKSINETVLSIGIHEGLTIGNIAKKNNLEIISRIAATEKKLQDRYQAILSCLSVEQLENEIQETQDAKL